MAGKYFTSEMYGVITSASNMICFGCGRANKF